MRIVERIKDAVEHTADSWQQKLLNEYNTEEPAARARKIISELVKQLERPNQVIINDIVSLIYALATNPDSAVDLEQVVSTAEMLIHELVEPIPNPDKRLMDELLHIVVHASSHQSRAQMAQAKSATNGQYSQSQPAKTASMASNVIQNPAALNSAQASQAAAAAQSQPSPPTQQSAITNNNSTSQPSNKSADSSNKPAVDNSMIKLIMDEMKEVIKKNQITEQRISEVENKLAGRISTTYDDIQTMKDKIKKQDADLETINKNLDKFISLYEIVINQYNPFIEHLEDPKKKEALANTPTVAPLAQVQKAPESVPSTSQNTQQTVATTSQSAQSSPSASTTSNNSPTPSQTSSNSAKAINELEFLIDEVKKMSETDFLSNKDKTSKWIDKVLGDVALASDYAKAQTQQEASKILLKKSFSLHTQ